MKKDSKKINKIGAHDPLPAHIKSTDGTELKYDEIRARFICEHIFQQKLIDSDRPDIHAEDGTFGIEVTSASRINCTIYRIINGEKKPFPINYNKLEGDKYKSVRNTGMIDPDLCFASIKSNPEDYKSIVLESLTDKLQKLNGNEKVKPYTHYAMQYLYITSIIDTVDFSVNDFMDLFAKSTEIQKEYEQFFCVIYLEGLDFLIEFNFILGKAYFRPDIFKEVPIENARARNYIIEKHNGGNPPLSPGEAHESLLDLIKL